MILFPGSKINLGLNVSARRPDGYHEVSTIMVAVDWSDVLEIIPTPDKQAPTLSCSGRPVDCPPEKNLVMKAYRALSDFTGGIPAADIYLEKIVPDGAGLGGGSADAAACIVGLNEVFNLGLPTQVLERVAATVGADCPFFISSRPAHCSGIGTTLSPVALPDLRPYSILIAKPRVASVSTKEAYAGIVPAPAKVLPAEALKLPVEEWRDALVNDFEASIFPRLPRVAQVKDELYAGGALYAAMSGSGAAVFGIFMSDILARKAAELLPDCDTRVCHARP